MWHFEPCNKNSRLWYLAYERWSRVRIVAELSAHLQVADAADGVPELSQGVGARHQQRGMRPDEVKLWQEMGHWKAVQQSGRRRSDCDGSYSLFQRYLGRKHWWWEWSPPLGSCPPLIRGSCQWSDAPGGQTHRRKALQRPTGRRYNILISCDLLTGFQQPTSSSAYRSCLFFTNFLEALRSCLSFRCLFKARTQALDLIPAQLVFSVNMTCKKEDTYSSVCSVESAGTISGSVFSSSAWQRRDSTLERKRRVRFILSLVWTQMYNDGIEM